MRSTRGGRLRKSSVAQRGGPLARALVPEATAAVGAALGRECGRRAGVGPTVAGSGRGGAGPLPEQRARLFPREPEAAAAQGHAGPCIQVRA